MSVSSFASHRRATSLNSPAASSGAMSPRRTSRATFTNASWHPASERARRRAAPSERGDGARIGVIRRGVIRRGVIVRVVGVVAVAAGAGAGTPRRARHGAAAAAAGAVGARGAVGRGPGGRGDDPFPGAGGAGGGARARRGPSARGDSSSRFSSLTRSRRGVSEYCVGEKTRICPNRLGKCRTRCPGGEAGVRSSARGHGGRRAVVRAVTKRASRVVLRRSDAPGTRPSPGRNPNWGKKGNTCLFRTSMHSAGGEPG
jgi:hypothetical protein